MACYVRMCITPFTSRCRLVGTTCRCLCIVVFRRTVYKSVAYFLVPHQQYHTVSGGPPVLATWRGGGLGAMYVFSVPTNHPRCAAIYQRKIVCIFDRVHTLISPTPQAMSHALTTESESPGLASMWWHTYDTCETSTWRKYARNTRARFDHFLRDKNMIPRSFTGG